MDDKTDRETEWTNENEGIEGFEKDFRVCSSEECKNYCLGQKNTCKYCTEVKHLWHEIKRLREMNDEMMEHMIDPETSQKGKSKRRKRKQNKSGRERRERK